MWFLLALVRQHFKYVATCNPRYIFGLGNGKKGGDLISDTNWHWHCKMYCMLYCDYFSNFVVMKKRTERCVTMIWQTMHMNDVIQIHTVFIIQFWKASKWYHYRISFDFTSLIARLIYHVLLLCIARWGKTPKNHILTIPIFNEIHLSEISFFTKFTFLKSYFSQNSRF